jgi:hypothetical protein
MRSIVGALVFVAAVAVPHAQGAFVGNLTTGAWSVDIASAATDDITLTVIEVKKAKLVVLGTMTVPTGITQQFSQPISRNVQRLIVEVDLPPGGEAVVRVAQGANTFVEDQVADHGVYVFNVMP